MPTIILAGVTLSILGGLVIIVWFLVATKTGTIAKDKIFGPIFGLALSEFIFYGVWAHTGRNLLKGGTFAYQASNCWQVSAHFPFV